MVSETGAIINAEANVSEIYTGHHDDDEDYYAEGFGVRPALKVKLTEKAFGLLTLTGDNVAVEKKTTESIKDKIVDISKADQGDIITFGTYEQDNNLENGQEPIRWIVLSKNKSRLLVMSKYGLDAQPYNSVEEDVRWENCSLRKWLNEDFYNTAFSDEEKTKIQTKPIKNDKNPFYETSTASADTQDKVFLLSIEGATNAEYRFNADRTYNDDLRKCAPTFYAINRGGQLSDDDTAENLPAGLWWFRTVGQYEYKAAYVIGRGYIRKDGWTVTNNYFIRPVISISLK